MKKLIESIKLGSEQARSQLNELLAKKVKDVVKEEQKKVAKCILIEEDITEELDPGDDAKVWIDDFIKSDAPQFKGKTKEQRINMALAAYYSARKEAGLEESKLDEAVKTTHVVIDTANDNVVVGAASDEDGAKRTISSSERPPISIKNKNTLKIVKLKKPAGEKKSMEMIGHPLKENAELEEDEYSELGLSVKHTLNMAQTFWYKLGGKREVDQKKYNTLEADYIKKKKATLKTDDAGKVAFKNVQHTLIFKDKSQASFHVSDKPGVKTTIGNFDALSVNGSRGNMFHGSIKKGDLDLTLKEEALDEATFKNKEVEKRFLAMKKMSTSQLKKVHSDTVGGSTSGMSDEDFINDILLSEFGIKKLSEQVDLCESVMDQKMWDKIKKGDKLTISYDDSFRSGNKVTLVVVSKNIVGKQKVGKMTMKLADGSSKFKFYIYNRDGRMGLAIGNLAASMTDIVMESEGVNPDTINEWGSSDWSGVIRSMDNYLKKRGVNPDTITQAAEDEAESYYDDMGYDSAEDAVPRIIDMWKRNSKTGQKLMAMFSKK